MAVSKDFELLFGSLGGTGTVTLPEEEEDELATPEPTYFPKVKPPPAVSESTAVRQPRTSPDVKTERVSDDFRMLFGDLPEAEESVEPKRPSEPSLKIPEQEHLEPAKIGFPITPEIAERERRTGLADDPINVGVSSIMNFLGSAAEKLSRPKEMKNVPEEEKPWDIKLLEKAGPALKGVSKKMLPDEDRIRNIGEKVKKLDAANPGLGASLKSGDLGGLIDGAYFDVAIGNPSDVNKDMFAVKKDYESVVSRKAEQSRDRNWFMKTVEATAEMLPMMGKSVALSAIPVVGKTLSTSMWARQGAGEMLARFDENDIPRDVGIPTAVIAGVAYAMTEQAQIGQLTNLGKKRLADKLWKRIGGVVAEKGVDWVKENLEEVGQGIIEEAAFDIASAASGKKINTGELVSRYGNMIVETLKQTAGPMGLLSLLGVGAGTAKAAIERKTSVSGNVSPDFEKLFGGPTAEQPATQPEAGRQTTTPEAAVQSGVQPEVAPGEAGKTLSDFGVTESEFDALPEARQNEIFQQLSEPEREKVVMFEPEPETATIEDIRKRIQEGEEYAGPEPTAGEAISAVYQEPVGAAAPRGTAADIGKGEVGKEWPAAGEVETEPSEAQKAAGNYKKGHIKIESFDISIENPAGSTRSGKDKDGKEWSQKINHDYGYIRGTKGADAFRTKEGTDQLDVFIKPGSDVADKPVYVINQLDTKSGKFDEAKNMFGFSSAQEAINAYLSNYEPGWKGAGSVVILPMNLFKKWAYSDLTKDELRLEYLPFLESLPDRGSFDPNSPSDFNKINTIIKKRKGEIEIPRGGAVSPVGSTNTPSLETLEDGGRGNVEPVGDLVESESNAPKSQSFFDRPRKFSGSMVYSMKGIGSDLKVGNRVVEPVTVDVVDYFGIEKPSSKVSLHDKSMLKDLPSSVSNKPVRPRTAIEEPNTPTSSPSTHKPKILYESQKIKSEYEELTDDGTLENLGKELESKFDNITFGGVQAGIKTPKKMIQPTMTFRDEVTGSNINITKEQGIEGLKKRIDEVRSSQQKEVSSAERTGTETPPGGEQAQGLEPGAEGRIRLRNYEEAGLEAKEGKGLEGVSRETETEKSREGAVQPYEAPAPGREKIGKGDRVEVEIPQRRWQRGDVTEEEESSLESETEESLDDIEFDDTDEIDFREAQTVAAMWGRVEEAKMRLKNEQLLYDAIRHPVKGVFGKIDAKSFGRESDPNFIRENMRFIAKTGGVNVDKARMDFIAQNRKTLQELGVNESDLETPDDFIGFLRDVATKKRMSGLKNEIFNGERDLDEYEKGRMKTAKGPPSPENMMQQNLFGGEKSQAEIDAEEKKRLERAEVKRRTEERRGGEADISNLPLFEDQDIEGSQQTLKLSKGEKQPSVKRRTPAATYENKTEERLTKLLFRSHDKEPVPGSIRVITPKQKRFAAIKRFVEDTTGKEAVFIETDPGVMQEKFGSTIDGISVPGAMSPELRNKIFIDVNSGRPVLWTAFHEFGHFLERNPHYNRRFWNAVRLTDAGRFELARNGKSEFAADIIGEMMSRQDFWENLEKHNRTTFENILREFTKILMRVSKALQKLITGEELDTDSKTQFEQYISDVNGLRDELMSIYSDFRKNKKEVSKETPERLAAAMRLFHGSPYSFEKFEMRPRTGEGSMRFGYGIYLTSKKEIADYYSKGSNVYSVNVHRGKKPLDYDYLQWNEELNDSQISKIKSQAKKEGGLIAEDVDAIEGLNSGSDLYHAISGDLGSDKSASEFLLRAGIDGIEYHSGTLTGKDVGSRNFVVFDPEAVTIEEKVQFAKGKKLPVLPKTIPAPTAEQVAEAKEEVSDATLRAKRLEASMRSLRKRLKGIQTDLLQTRAEIGLQLEDVREAQIDQLKTAIYDYAKKIGLSGVPYNKVDLMLKNVTTAAGLRKAVDRLDGIWSSYERRAAYVTVLDRVEKEYRRLAKIQSGKAKSTVDAKHNNRLKQYLDSLKTKPEWFEGDDYYKLIDNMLSYYNQYAAKDIKKAKSTAELPVDIQRWMDDPSQPVPDKLKKMIQAMFEASISSMNAEQLNGVVKNIDNIKEWGKTFLEIQEEERRDKLNADAADATKRIRKTHKKGEKPPWDKAVEHKYLGRVGKMGEEYFWSFIDAERMVEWLTAFDGYEGLKDRILQPFYDAENKKILGMEAATDNFMEIHKDIDWREALGNKKYMTIDMKKIFDKHKLEFAYSDKVSSFNLSLDNMMFIYANTKNPGNLAHLRGTFGYAEVADDIIDMVVKKLPAANKKAVDEMVKYYDDEQWGRVSDVFEREMQIALPKEDNYFPIMNISTDRAESAVVADFLARNSSKIPSVQKGMIRSRVGSESPFKRMSYFHTVTKNLQQVEHYVAYNDAVREVHRFLTNPTVRAAIELKSEQVYKQLEDWVRAVARGKVSGSEHIIDKAYDFIRHNFTTYALALKVTTGMQQFSSLSKGMAMIDGSNPLKPSVAKAAMAFLMDPVAAERFSDSKSPMMKNRQKSYERELAEFAEKSITKKFAKMENVPNKIKSAMMWHIGKMDKVVATILWNAKYNEQIKQGTDEKTAIKKADEMIRKTQSRGGILYLPKIYRSGGLVRAMTIFTSDINQNINIGFEMYGKLGKQNAVKTANDVFWNIFMSTTIIWMINNGFQMVASAIGGGDEGEKDYRIEEWFKELTSQMTGGFFYLSPIFQAVVGMVADEVKEARGIIPDKRWKRWVADFVPAGSEAIEKLVDAGKNKDPYALLDAVWIFGGIPYRNAKRLYEGLKAVKEEGAQEWRRMFWSDRVLREETVFNSMARRFYSPRPKTDDFEKYSEWYHNLDPYQKRAFDNYQKKWFRENDIEKKD